MAQLEAVVVPADLGNGGHGQEDSNADEEDRDAAHEDFVLVIDIPRVLGRVNIHVDGPENEGDEGRDQVDVAHDREVCDNKATLDDVTQDLEVQVVDPLYHTKESSVQLCHQAVVDDDLEEEEEAHLTAVEIELAARIRGEVTHEGLSLVLVLDLRSLPDFQLVVEISVVLNVQCHLLLLALNIFELLFQI